MVLEWYCWNICPLEGFDLAPWNSSIWKISWSYSPGFDLCPCTELIHTWTKMNPFLLFPFLLDICHFLQGFRTKNNLRLNCRSTAFKFLMSVLAVPRFCRLSTGLAHLFSPMDTESYLLSLWRPNQTGTPGLPLIVHCKKLLFLVVHSHPNLCFWKCPHPIVPANYCLTAFSTLSPHWVFQWRGSTCSQTQKKAKAPGTPEAPPYLGNSFYNCIQYFLLVLAHFLEHLDTVCSVCVRDGKQERLRQRPNTPTGSFETKETFKTTYLWL